MLQQSSIVAQSSRRRFFARCPKPALEHDKHPPESVLDSGASHARAFGWFFPRCFTRTEPSTAVPVVRPPCDGLESLFSSLSLSLAPPPLRAHTRSPFSYAHACFFPSPPGHSILLGETPSYKFPSISTFAPLSSCFLNPHFRSATITPVFTDFTL